MPFTSEDYKALDDYATHLSESEDVRPVTLRNYLSDLRQFGLFQQGYPMSDQFTEVSDTDGKPYLAQYFERAVFA